MNKTTKLPPHPSSLLCPMMDPSEAILETLTNKGWSFRDPEEMKSLIQANSNSLQSTESELFNTDLRSIGAKSLPDVKKSSYLTGPKILQLVSLRDIYQSSIDASFKNSQRSRRLLKFVLTDGHSEVVAIEYAPIPSITEDIAPGAKICLGNKVVVRSGILCLNAKVVTVMGGVVTSLYEEWQMSQKYSGFSRSSARASKDKDGDGPPPFEKLQVDSHRQHAVLHESTLDYPSHRNDSTQAQRNQDHHVVNKGFYSSAKAGGKTDRLVNDTMADIATDSKMVSSAEKTEDKPCSSEIRPKEVSEAVPVQNQAAAQKLLHKLNQPIHGVRNSKDFRHRFKGKQEETQVFTLEEWEKRKGNNLKSTMTSHTEDVSRDEELARQLQNQLDLEDFHGKPNYTEAEQIRMSMFSFVGPDESSNNGRRDFRGRGRGRGRGRRGRGKFS